MQKFLRPDFAAQPRCIEEGRSAMQGPRLSIPDQLLERDCASLRDICGEQVAFGWRCAFNGTADLGLGFVPCRCEIFAEVVL